MPDNTKQAQEMVLMGLQFLIMQNAISLGSEQRDPGCDPDRSDEYEKRYTLTLARLRRMRDDFECVVSGVTL
jgi:hypothetical protein